MKLVHNEVDSCTTSATVIKRVAQPARAADAASRPRDRAHFRNRIRTDCHLDLDRGAADAQHVGLLNTAQYHLHWRTITDRVTLIYISSPGWST
jgi:hypothetical protein